MQILSPTRRSWGQIGGTAREQASARANGSSGMPAEASTALQAWSGSSRPTEAPIVSSHLPKAVSKPLRADELRARLDYG